MTLKIDLVKALRCDIYREEISTELEGDITDSVMHEAADEIERLRAALERIEGIHRRNYGHQTEKLADIGPIAREALNFREPKDG